MPSTVPPNITLCMLVAGAGGGRVSLSKYLKQWWTVSAHNLWYFFHWRSY